MATHSSVLAWRIPGMGEPDGLPSMGSHRVGHDWSDLAAAAQIHYSTAFSPRYFSKKKENTCPHENSCISIHNNFIYTALKQRKPKDSSVENEQTYDVISIQQSCCCCLLLVIKSCLTQQGRHTIEYHCTINRNEVLICTPTW